MRGGDVMGGRTAVMDQMSMTAPNVSPLSSSVMMEAVLMPPGNVMDSRTVQTDLMRRTVEGLAVKTMSLIVGMATALMPDADVTSVLIALTELMKRIVTLAQAPVGPMSTDVEMGHVSIFGGCVMDDQTAEIALTRTAVVSSSWTEAGKVGHRPL